MPTFEIRGRGRKSGRPRKRIYVASNEPDAIAKAGRDGTDVEEVCRLPDEPATDRQQAYAQDLGLPFPEDITKAEMSDLLDCYLSYDKVASERDRWFALRFSVEPSPYIGKRALFDLIAAALRKKGAEEDLASWFIYRVCRHLVHGGQDHPSATGPDAPIVREIATRFAGSPALMTSIRRYEGRKLIWFGQWTSPDGLVHEGGSIRTVAYRTAAGLLREWLGLQRDVSRSAASVAAAPSKGRRSAMRKTQKRGCFGVLVLLVLLGLIFAALAALVR